jgi:hypothetical protein
MKPWNIATVGVILALLLSGCATRYQFEVDALASPGAGPGKRFVIEEPAGAEAGSRLRYREAADFVSRALVSRGWELVNQPSEAEMVISLSAKVSEPLNETERHMEPVYYRTWGYSRVVRTPVVDKSGNVRHVATRVYVPPQTHFGGYAHYDRNVVVYRKSLDLTARRPGGEELWTLSVRTIDESSDLRSYIPLLAAAALPYIGGTTDGVVVVSLREEDEAVRYLRQRGPTGG